METVETYKRELMMAVTKALSLGFRVFVLGLWLWGGGELLAADPVHPEPARTGGWSGTSPPNQVTPNSGKRNHVFYVGEALTFGLGGAATTYEVRDYFGNLVDQGAAGASITIKSQPPGWYKLYVYGSATTSQWGDIVGGTTFVIFRNTPNFLARPAQNANGGPDGLGDEVVSGLISGGPERIACTDVNNPNYGYLDAFVAATKQWYVPTNDAVRPHPAMIAFPNLPVNAAPNTAGITAVVNRYKNDIKYWEPRNEPNDHVSGSGFVTNELIPFYNAVKSGDPTAKVMGPGTVALDSSCRGWLEDFFKGGGGNYIDAFSFHAYNLALGDIFIGRERLNWLKDLLSRYGKSNIEKWQTEQGYSAPTYGVYWPRHQGRWTMMQMMLFEQYGLPKEHNHLWYDRSGGFWEMPMWVENDDGGFNPAAALMRVWSEELYGKIFAQAFDFGPAGSNLYLGSLFTGAGGSTAAFMSCGMPNGKVVLQVSGSSLHVVSAFGVVSDLPVANGKVTLPVPEIPVYVELAGGQTLQVIPMDWGQNLARQSGVSAAVSGGTASNNNLLFNGKLEDWYLDGVFCWNWNAPTPGNPQWLEVDLPAKTTVGRVVVYSGFPWQTRGTLVDYELQYDNNGQWVTIERITEPTKTFGVFTPTVQCTVDSYFSDRYNFVHEFTPVTTQKIRLMVYQCSYGGGATAIVAQAGGQASATPTFDIREIEIYGAANLGNVPPVVALTAPANGATFTAPANITLTATASDSDGTVAKVEFYNGPTLLGTAAASPYSFTWSNVAAGSYALTAKATDNSGAATTSAVVNITVGVAAPPPGGGSGKILREWWTGIGGTAVTDLTGNALYPNSPTGSDFPTSFEGPTNWADNYGTRMRGYVFPPVTGAYTFWIASDDNGELWLSTDENPANKTKIATVSGWAASRAWDTAAEQKSAAITLTAGRKYYVEALQKEGGGGDDIAVAWQMPGSSRDVIAGQYLSPFVVAANLPPVVALTGPANNATFTTPANVTLTATAADSDGMIAKVEFYQGATLLGTATANPYSFTWNSVAAGSYTLTAKAYDNSGASATSAAVNITVNAASGGQTVYLSDLNWTSAISGWGPIEKDKSNGDNVAGDGHVITLNGVTYAKGLGMHAAADVRYNLGGTYTTFISDVGVDDEVGNSGSVVFQVWTDGVQLYDSGVMTGASANKTINVSVAGKNELKLLVTDGGDGMNSDHADWAGARLIQGGIPANQPPTVSVTAPANNATFTAPANITITANAADSDGTITKVEFYSGATLLGTDTTSPYSYAWSGVAAGTYSLTAKAYDNGGAITTSTAVGITVNPPANLPPTVSLTAPANGATYTAPASVTLTANAADSDGTVAKVEFYQGANLLGTVTASPYNFPWNSVAAGTYALTAKATDNAGAATTSATVNITVNAAPPPNQAPTVSLTAPANNATFTAPANITITATAADSDGTVAKVEFYNGATLLGTATASPYSFTWNNVAAGSYALTAKATDNVGASTTSATVNITVNAAPPPPSGGTGLKGDYFADQNLGTVKLTRTDATVNFDWGSGSPDPAIPVDHFSIRWTGQVQAQFSETYTFYTQSDDGVRLWVNGQLLVDKWIDQGTTEWNGTIALTAGQKYDLKMEYYENGGGAAAKLLWSSASTPKAAIPQASLFPAAGTAPPPNQPPTVTLTSPTNSATFTAPANITITATAADSDGTVAKIEFYNGGTLLGTATASPYSFAWNNVAAGSYALTAKATDNVGAVTTSATVNITVNAAPPPPGGALPAPWQHQDIGAVGIAGDATYANGTFTVKGSGADIWNNADAFHFVYQPLSGDGTIVARVASIQTTDPWAKAGVMIRQTLNANSTYAMMILSASNGLSLQSRPTEGGACNYTAPVSATAPTWVKLVRSGNTFSASSSADGINWTSIGSTTITMNAGVYIGLAVTAHNNGLLNTSTLDNVTVTPPPDQPPTGVAYQPAGGAKSL